jgi:tetratricopeptide (TPR) repeat protein
MQYHNWTGAALCLQRAHDIATKSGLTSSVDFALNQIVLADCYYELEQYKDAWRLYQPAIDKLITIGEDLDRVVAIGRLGDILLRAGNLPHAEKYLKHAMHLSRGDRAEGRVIIKGTNPVSNQDFALTVSRLADVYRLEGKLGEAAQTYSEAIEIWKKLEGDGAKKDLAICLYYLGEVQRIQGHEQEAGSSYKEALDVAQSAFGPQDPHVANILYRYSDVLWHQNQWLQALDLKAKANAIRKTAK